MSVKLVEIVEICKHGRNIQLFEPFLNHFCDIDYACLLSEICVNSVLSVQHGAREGWFRRTYEEWEILTGIPATRARRVCLDLASSGFIVIKLEKKSSHFQAVPDAIAMIMGDAIPNLNRRIPLGLCPECGSDVIEGKKSYLCSSWVKGKQNVCRFCIWKDTLSRNGKLLITAVEARLLLSGSEIQLLNLIGTKSKKPFSCKGILHKREGGKYGIQFVFQDHIGAENPMVFTRKSDNHAGNSREGATGGQGRRIRY
ncbi:MAG: hypothetical protein ABSG48_06490 [Geobacteraceae bacterium]|jgi:hypothetical protein